jgi:bifunctional aspartokinase / homoserine dehydrogenase 1
MAKFLVYKFGGTSVGTAAAVRLAAEHVRRASPGVATVVSAMSGVTDLLLNAARAALRGRGDEVASSVAAFTKRHLDLIAELLPGGGVRASALAALVGKEAADLQAICQSIEVLKELSPRTLDAAVARGERALARIFEAVLLEGGTAAAYVDATEVIHTSRQAGILWPDWERCEAAAKEHMRPLIEAGRVAVMPGYIAAGPDGEVVTLGRGGSDFSAAILARLVHAAAVALYKEVDGLMTADPKWVPEARVIPELHYREAAELAYYGAKVLHPRTMAPLVAEQIPLFIRNTFKQEGAGTRIAGDVKPSVYPVKALTGFVGQAIITVEGNGMMGVPGIASRTFGALSAAGHSVSMISQASSEATICFTVPQEEADHARARLEEAFATELKNRLIDTIRVEKHRALLAVVGLGMRGVPGVSARTFSVFGRQQIDIQAIAQGSSELNITVAIDEADMGQALQGLHREFQLDRLWALPDSSGREANVILLGFGQIGGTLARQLTAQQGYFAREFGLTLRCVAVADRASVQLFDQGLDAARLQALGEARAKRKSSGSPARDTIDTLAELRAHVWPLPLHQPIVVDVTAAETADIILDALRRGYHVVLANKKPLTVAQERFDEMMEAARASGVSLRCEATVGAGLPVFDTLAKLREVGDGVQSITGCLSGTLGYLMSELERGVAFSAAVREAHRLGYTEPDPRDDLSGMDVARKALILARALGRKVELSDLRVEPLFPPELLDGDVPTFLERLGTLDASYADKQGAARRDHKVLRYAASVSAEGIRVGLEAVPVESQLGQLRGADNQIVIHSQQYSARPLVLSGPGAGAAVTAAGVLNDILAIATGQDRRPMVSIPLSRGQRQHGG